MITTVQPIARSPVSKRIQKQPEELVVAESEEDRLASALSAAAENRDFYQKQVDNNCLWFRGLTITALLGSALTPLIAIFCKGSPWIAVPSAIAGLAVAANSAFHFEEEWAQNYFTLSAIVAELDLFCGRVGPDYDSDKSLSQAADTFQRKMSEIVMSEVKLWRKTKTGTARRHKKN